MARRRHQHVEDALFGRVFRQCALGRGLAFALLLHRCVDQVADDRVDVLADIADLGELGRFDLDERRVGQLGKAASDLRFADTSGADHQNVLRRDLAAQLLIDLLAPPAVAQGDGDGAFGVGLADNVAIEFGDDLIGRNAANSRTSIEC